MKKLLTKYLVVLISVFLGVLLIMPSLIMADGYTFPSTNELNKAQQAPGHEGQLVPYVELVEAGVGYVKLDFVGGYVGGAYFEYRIDGVLVTSGTPHLVVIGDFEYPGVWVVANTTVQREISANIKVEVRLALGGERDWDFDWTTFEVLSKKNGPADKATGSYWVEVNGSSYYTEISAHEAIGNKDAKGNFYWSGVRGGQPYYFEATVTDADISGNTAKVWGTVDNVVGTSHIRVGWTFWFIVVDGGTPGSNGDTMEYQWLTGNNSHWNGNVTDGNLVVHTYE